MPEGHISLSLPFPSYPLVCPLPRKVSFRVNQRSPFPSPPRRGPPKGVLSGHISHSHPIPPLRGYKMGIEMVMAQRARPVGPIPLKYTFRVRVNLFFCYAPNGLLAAPTIGTLWPFSLLFFLVSSSPLVCPERSPFGAFFFVELCSPLSF